MSRPRKDSDKADARGRIIEAFWSLLETNRLESISVRAVTNAADCNRGTFYYHFRDMEDLCQNALGDELLGNGFFPNLFNSIVCGEKAAILEAFFASEYPSKLVLLLEHGGVERTINMLRGTMCDIWSHILYPAGGEISLGTRMLIGCIVSGNASLISDMCHYELETGSRLEFVDNLPTLLDDVSTMVINQVAIFEGMEPDAVRCAIASFDFDEHPISGTDHVHECSYYEPKA